MGVASVTRTLALVVAGLAIADCNRSTPTNDVANSPASRAPASEARPAATAPARHDLAADEAMGGHTLLRHVGKTDAELRDRLRREPEISAASSYTDRDTAERVVAAALESTDRSFGAWRGRTGTRPNFVLHYAGNETIGRSLSRGRSASTLCHRAIVVLRWENRTGRFFVLTSYPEESR